MNATNFRMVPPSNKEPRVSAKVQDIDIEALDALIQRLEQAKEHQLTLDPADIALLIAALQTLAHVQTTLSNKDITLYKLRKLLGIVASSEQLNKLLPQTKEQRRQDKKRAQQDKPTPPPSVPPKSIHHALETVSKGERCPECEQGTLYKYEPAVLLRISGQNPYQAERHIMERLRCNACGAYFTAPLPEAVAKDGEANQKYGATARSLMVLNKYYMGQPFYRQENLSQMLGMTISASTQFDQCEQVANALQPVYRTIVQLAADAKRFTIDDTSHRILTETERLKPDRKTGKNKRRTGVNASGLIATLDTDQIVVLIQTNIGHAGEWLDEILKPRASNLSPPLLMSDALSHNRPTVTEVIHGLCNAHGRRQFVDIIESFPTAVPPVLEQYKRIWKYDDKSREQGLSPEQRQAYHLKHSLPVMAALKQQFEQQLASKDVEENSGLGQAMGYFIRHYDGLTQFCRAPGMPLDNNRMETELKVLIRNRKNAYFYKTLTGAHIGDMLISTITTCIHNSVNPFDYLTWVQQNKALVKQNPHACLPWNYQQTAEKIAA